jgi:hypothetical protein
MKHIILFFLLYIAKGISYGQWNLSSSTNNAICTDINSQQEPRIISDGNGGAIVCWTDFRTDTTNKIGDVYAQKIRSNGTVSWTLNGVSICNQSADQTAPVLAEDGQGGAIITWQDIRNGNRDIYAQRIDSNGIALWTNNGVAVAQKNMSQRSPRILSDGNKGAIIVWEDSINGASDIYIQKINSNGSLAWNANGVAVCNSIGVQINTKVCSDGNGGAIVTWQDKRNGNDYDIYAQKISSSGIDSWTTGGKPICVRINTQSNPKIETDNAGGAYVIWQDKRGAIDFDIYCQHINNSGIILWALNGALVCNAIGSQSAVDATSDGITNGIIITWKDGRTINNHIYAQMLNSTGNELWTSNGINLSNSTYPQLNPNIVGVGNNEAVITWQDSISGAWDVYSQKINASGNVMWSNGGECVSNAPSNQTSPKNVSTGNGGCIYAFQDKRNGNSDIYAWQLKSNGTPTSISIIADEYEISIFPNPSNGSFYLSGDEEFANNFSVNILNNVGKIVYQTKLISGSRNATIETNLEPGIYFVSVTNTDLKKRFNTKIIINE